MEYSFNRSIAVFYGLEEAVMIHNFVHWIDKNRANKKHLHDGTFWTYNTIEAFTQLFPFWTKRQVERIIKSLLSQKAILSGEFNDKGYDRTRWYAIANVEIFKCYGQKPHLYYPGLISPNGDIHFTERVSPFHQTVVPIPDSKTDSKPDKELDKSNSIVDLPLEDSTDADSVNPDNKPDGSDNNTAKATTKRDRARAFVAKFNEIKKIYAGRLGVFRVNELIFTRFDKAIRDYESKEILSAMHAAFKDDFHKENNFKYLTPEYILRTKSLETYCNAADDATVQKPREMVY